MSKVSFALDLKENVVGDIVFIDNNGTQIESNAKPITHTTTSNNNLAKSWNLSKTGSFEMNGLKIKNGIKESPSKDRKGSYNTIQQGTDDDESAQGILYIK